MDISSLLDQRPQRGNPDPSAAGRQQVIDPALQGDQREGSSHMGPQSLPLPPPGPPANYQSAYPPPYQHHYQGPYGHQMPQAYGPGPGGMAQLPPMQQHQDPRMQGPPGPMLNYAQSKRLASGVHPNETPAKKKQSKWSAEEDAAIIELRGNGMKWEDISRNLPGRSAISCRLRFQNYLERRSEWDEEKKNKLARLYERFKKDMWEKIAKEMALPWRAAEAMHWQIGEVEMANRANVPVFHLAGYSPSQPTPSSYSTSISTPTQLSGSERRSDGSASPHSLNEQQHPYYQGSGVDIHTRESQLRANERMGNRRTSDMSLGADQDDSQGRRSPRPFTAHDSVANAFDRDGTTGTPQYLSPRVKGEEQNHGSDGRRSPSGRHA